MSQFNGTKCDECHRIQGEANHWVRIQVWFQKGECVAVVILEGMHQSTVEGEYRDLCGQGCAMKHIAKLLKWTVPTGI